MNHRKVCLKPIADYHKTCAWCSANVTIEESPEEEMTKGDMSREIYRLQIKNKKLATQIDGNARRIEQLEKLFGV